MKDYKIGDIIDETEFTDASLWCSENNATLTEIEPVIRDVEEKYTVIVPVEKKAVVPAVTHDEVVPAVYDDDGNLIEPEKTITVIDEPEHTETITEEEELEETRIVQKEFRQFEIIEIPAPPPPTWEDIDKAREEYREQHIDKRTKARVRKMANGTWTEKDEQEYLALDAEVTAWIEENLPYPVGE